MFVKAPEKLFLYHLLMNYDGFLVYFMAFFMKMQYLCNFPQTACCDGRSLPSPMILAAVFSQNSKSQQKADFREKKTYFFGFYGPKIGGGGSSYPAFVQKHQKP